MTSPVAERTSSPTSPSGLRGNLGVPSIVFMVVAGAAPLTVVGGPMPLAFAVGNGSGVPVAFIVAALVLLLFAIGFTAMTPHVKSAGAFYSYVDAGLGRSAGIGTGYAALLSYVVLYAGVYALMGTGLAALVTSFGGPDIPWWIWSFIAFAVAAFLGYRNIALSGRVLGVLLIAEIVIVLALDAAIIFTGGGDEGFSTGFLSPAQIISGAPGLAVLFAVLSFIGFEATAVFRDEARDPARTIPRATYIAVIFVGVFYAITSWAMASAVGDSKVIEVASADSAAMLPDLATQYLGRVGGDLVAVLFVTSVFACALTFHNVVARYLFSLSSRGLLPSAISVAHPRFGSPARASIVGSVVVAALIIPVILIGLDPINQFYTWFAGLASVGYVLLLIVTTAAVIVFFRKRTIEGARIWQTLVAPVLALIALLGFLGLIMTNLMLLVGGDPVVATIVIVLLVSAFALGPIIGKLRTSASRPVD